MTKTFVIAPDSFKESMSAIQACNAIKQGLHVIFPDAHYILCPMADGGEGTVDAMINALEGEKIPCQVTGPLPHQSINTYIGLIEQGKTAVIEMAKANGIDLLPQHQRNPLKTSTFGTGEMIIKALELGVSKIIIGLGGSVTNDAGMGMAHALGVKFLDEQNQPVALGCEDLHRIKTIDISELDQRLNDVEIIIASDVNNPLIGEDGATYVFARQKGATEEMLPILEKNITHFATLIEQQLNKNIKQVSGAGAAGGLAAGLLAFTSAKLCSGIETVIETIQLVQHIAKADYVFTGEGGIDFQTKFGKTPIGIARLAKKHHKPVIVCAGYVGENIETLYEDGITAIFGILDKSCDLEAALKNGEQNLTRTCENIARLIIAQH